MQTSVFAFVVIDVDGNFLDQAQGAAVGGLEAFEIGGEDVVGFADGNPLGELPAMIRIDLPADFLGFVGGATDFHENAIDFTIVRAPHGSGDQSIVFRLGIG